MSRYRLLGEATTPQEIADALNSRRQELALRMVDLGEGLGFAHGYVNKLFAQGYPKNLGKESMPAMLAALGCKIAIVCDEEAQLPPIIRRAIEERTGGAGVVGRPHKQPSAAA